MLRQLAALLLFAPPAAADVAESLAHRCDDLWFIRNRVVDMAGYCFSSPLGAAVFDNGDCTGTAVSLGPQAEAFVAYIRGLEAEAGCNVDTSRTSLGLTDLPALMSATDLPVPDRGEFACLGWMGPAVPLFAGPRPEVPIGRIDPGDTVALSYVPAGDWSFVSVYAPGGSFRSGGWLRLGASPLPCAQEAG